MEKGRQGHEEILQQVRLIVIETGYFFFSNTENLKKIWPPSSRDLMDGAAVAIFRSTKVLDIQVTKNIQTDMQKDYILTQAVFWRIQN